MRTPHKKAHHSNYAQTLAHFKKASAPLLRKICPVIARLKHISRRQVLIATGASTLIICSSLLASFLWPHSLTFSYAGTNCFFNPVVLPGFAAKHGGPTFAAQNVPTLAIGNVTLYSATTCIDLAKAPHATAPETITVALFGSAFLTKKITVTPGELPTAKAMVALNKPIAPADPLIFALDQPDYHFDYRLTANNKTVTCQKKDATFSCDIASVGFAQGTQYPLLVERLFKGDVSDAVVQQTITTVAPIEMTGASIGNGQTVYDVPADLSLTFNKPVRSFDGLLLKQGDAQIGVTTSVDGAKITVHFNAPLARQATFDLSIATVTADDGGYLNAYTQQFATSGGPKVVGVSIGSAKVRPDSSFTITFDSDVSGAQQLQNFIRVESGGNRLTAGVTLHGNSVTVSPEGLQNCQNFTVKVLDGLQNAAGITGGSAWQLNSRTICQSTFSIGASVHGRAITGYKFGNGPVKIVLVGTIHGDERSAANLLNSLVGYLEANGDKIPTDHTIVIIPVANPDGYATGSRYNANGVDLNRNFPANNWKSGVVGPNGDYQPNGGGSAPLSEPESRALANYIAGEHPRLVLSYHAYAHLIAANEAGDSLSIAHTYGNQIGYPVFGSDGASQFNYDTTGAFEDWMHDAQGITGILIELRNKTGNDFSSHRSVLMGLLQL